MYRVVAQPTEELLSLADIANYLRVTHTLDDGLMQLNLQAAVERVESLTGLALLHQQREMHSTCGGSVDLIGWPVASVDSVTVGGVEVDRANSLNTAPLSRPARVSDLPTGEMVTIRYTCGWTAANAVPAELKLAALMLISGWYSNRVVNWEKPTIPRPLPHGVDAICKKYREVSF